MARLPFEILAAIAEALRKDIKPLDSMQQRDLVQLCATSHTFNQISIPFLYRWCGAHSLSAAKILLNTLSANPLAATCVRHLEIHVTFSRHDLEDVAPLLARALESVPSLVSLSLQLFAEPRRGTGSDHHITPSDSEDLSKQVLRSSLGFPFRIRLFSTNLACTPSLNDFISAQSSLSSIRWINPRIMGRLNPTFPPSVVSQAFTGLSTFSTLAGSIPALLAKAPSVRRILIDTDVREVSWLEDSDVPPFFDMPAIHTLEGLTLLVRGSDLALTNIVLDLMAPGLHSLAQLEISCDSSPPSECRKLATRLCRKLHTIDTFILSAVCTKEYLAEWIADLASGNFPSKVEIYTILEPEQKGQYPTYVRVCRDDLGNWAEEYLSPRDCYPIKAGGRNSWRITPNPERVMSISHAQFWA